MNVLLIVTLLASTRGQKFPPQLTFCPTAFSLLQKAAAEYWVKSLKLSNSAAVTGASSVVSSASLALNNTQSSEDLTLPYHQRWGCQGGDYQGRNTCEQGTLHVGDMVAVSPDCSLSSQGWPVGWWIKQRVVVGDVNIFICLV